MSNGPDPKDRDETFSILDKYVEQLHCGSAATRDELLAAHPKLADMLDCVEVLESLAALPAAAPDADPNRDAETVDFSEGLGRAEAPVAITSAVVIGSSFGKYQLLEEIGRGGMGVVFKAQQADLGRTVAVKMILANHLASEEHVRRFYTEARAAGRLQHPNIVAVHEVGQAAGQHFLAMEYIEGPSLEQVLAHDGPLEPVTAAEILATVARAVDYLHSQDVVHRDLKPANILLDEAWSPYVTDFGLAKLFDTDEDPTRSGTICGTPGYMAPEQAAGRTTEIGSASDVYSLGAILYALLTGRAPFQADSPIEVILQVLESDPVRPRRFDTKVPRSLEMICLKCLEKVPDRRYASAAALADDLDRYIQGEPVEARRAGPGQLLRRWVRREPALALRLAALAAFGVAESALYYIAGVSDATYHYTILTILAAWALSSALFQKLLDRPRWSVWAMFGWAAADAVFLTAVLLVGQGVDSPVLIGLPLLIAAAGLWSRVRLVFFMTAVSLALYVVLILDAIYRRPELRRPFDFHVVFMLALVVVGLVIAYQVQRIRFLSRYYDRRNQVVPAPSQGRATKNTKRHGKGK